MQSKLMLNAGLCLALGLCSSLLAGAAGAQPFVAPQAPSSSMKLLAERVVQTNPEIVAQREQVRIAKARMQAAEAGYLPVIDANGLVQKRQIDIKNGGPGDSRFVAAQGSIEARVRVYDGDRTYNAVQVAKAELAAAEAALEAIISEVLLELLTTASDVHSERRIGQYSEQQSDAIEEQLRATSRRLEFGESTRTDENLAKARLATSQAGILSATESLNISGNRFRAVSGQSATVVPSLPALSPLPGSLAQALTMAGNKSARIRVAQLNAAAGKIGVNFAKGALFPQLDAVGGYEYLTGGVANLFTGKLPDDRSALFAGIELNAPIFQPRAFAEIRRARAVRDQRLAQTEFAIRTVNQEVATAWTQWQSAKSIILATDAAVGAIDEAAEGIKKEFIGGNRTLAEVLDAQNELLAARISLERARRNEFVARASVLAAAGLLDVDAILAGNGEVRAGDLAKPEISSLGIRPVPQVSPQEADEDGVVAPDRPELSPLGTMSVQKQSRDETVDAPETDARTNTNRPEPSSLGSKVNPTK